MQMNLTDLEERVTEAIHTAVNVPKPNVDTDKHLALVTVEDLRTVLGLLQAAKNVPLAVISHK